MNNVLREGYRFFQASYDPMMSNGTFREPRCGRKEYYVYRLYVIFKVIGFILCLVGKNSRFMKLSRQLKDLRGGARKTTLLVAVLLSVGGLRAQGAAAPEMKRGGHTEICDKSEHAAKFGALPIQSVSGRIADQYIFFRGTAKVA